MTELEAARAEAELLANRLEGVFDAFSGRNESLRAERQRAKRGIGGLFRGWFSTSPSLEPGQARFLSDAGGLSQALAEALECLPAGPGREALAERAVACFLSPKPQGEKTPEEWFLTAAESLCAPLLPYLPSSGLARARDSILAHTPRKFLFPKQLELVERMEALLEAAEPS